LHEKGTSRWNAQSPHRTRAKPWLNTPHRRNFRELVDDEPGEITAVRLRVDSGEEFGEVRAHDPVEHARGRRSRHVDSSHAIGP